MERECGAGGSLYHSQSMQKGNIKQHQSATIEFRNKYNSCTPYSPHADVEVKGDGQCKCKVSYGLWGASNDHSSWHKYCQCVGADMEEAAQCVSLAKRVQDWCIVKTEREREKGQQPVTVTHIQWGEFVQ